MIGQQNNDSESNQDDACDGTGVTQIAASHGNGFDCFSLNLPLRHFSGFVSFTESPNGIGIHWPRSSTVGANANIVIHLLTTIHANNQTHATLKDLHGITVNVRTS